MNTNTCTIRTVLVGQSGGPTAAINATLSGVISQAEAHGVRVLGMVGGIQGLLAHDGADVCDLSALAKTPNFELLSTTPGAYLGSCRYKLPQPSEDPDTFEHINSVMDALDAQALIYIGGNDSMDTIAKLSSYEAQHPHGHIFVGAPKTIDNDLVGTHTTPGYGSAAKFIASSVADLLLDASVYAKPNVLVVEIMGRDAGWLTLAADLGGAPMLILPEFVAPVPDIIKRVQELLAQTHTVVVAVSEGARVAEDVLLCDYVSTSDTDAFGHRAQLSGAGRALAQIIKDELGVKTRAVEFSTLQRCCSFCTSVADLELARAAGVGALDLAVAGHTGSMACLTWDDEKGVGVSAVEVHTVANQVRYVDQTFFDPQHFRATQAARDYVLPLIAGSVALVERAGIPLHLRRS